MVDTPNEVVDSAAEACPCALFVKDSGLVSDPESGPETVVEEGKVKEVESGVLSTTDVEVALVLTSADDIDGFW